MELLWSAGLCIGLWVLFPKAFKFWVGSLVGTVGGIFFWSIGFFAWSFIASVPSWHQMGWSLIGFVVAGNVAGLFCAAKG